MHENEVGSQDSKRRLFDDLSCAWVNRHDPDHKIKRGKYGEDWRQEAELEILCKWSSATRPLISGMFGFNSFIWSGSILSPGYWVLGTGRSLPISRADGISCVPLSSVRG